MNTGRFLDGPEFGVLHDRGNKEDVFDRLDFKPGQSDTININFGFTRSWFQAPNSYDAQSATAWSGLVVDNGGIGPTGQVVGPADQRAQIRTFNIAPNWTRAIGGDKVWNLLGLGATGSIQLLPEQRSIFRPAPQPATSNGGTEPQADQYRGGADVHVFQRHSQSQGRRDVRAHLSHRTGQLGNRRPDL